MSLIDRINLHFKLGYRAVVKFSDEEMVWVRAIDECDTFQKVCVTAKMLSDWIDEQEENQQEDQFQEQQSDGAGEEDGESQESSDKGEEQQGSKGRKGDDENETEQKEEDVNGGQPEVTETDEKVSQTQRSLEENQKDLAGPPSNEKCVTVSADPDISNIIGIEQLRASFKHPVTSNYGVVASEDLQQFLISTKKEVNHMVQRFEMKKSADAYARASVNKTGVLNTSRLHQYKLTDDIFLRQTVTRDGKSHGMVMFVDWSGSMVNVLGDTVKQLITLVLFCQKVQIPFEVYTFTTSGRSEQLRDVARNTKTATVVNGSVELVQILTSTAKKNELKQDILNIYTQALYLTDNYNRVTGKVSSLLSLGGTPLNNALTMVPEIINQFRANTGAQRVSFVALTDGESSPIQYFDGKGSYGYGYYEKNHLKYGHNSYAISHDWNEYETVGIVNVLKKVTTDVTFTNIFLGSKRQSEQHIRRSGALGFSIPTAIWNKNNGVFATPNSGWDLVSCLNAKSFNRQQDDIEIEEGAKKGQIRTAFKKFLKAQSTSKVILDEMVEQFC